MQKEKRMYSLGTDRKVYANMQFCFALFIGLVMGFTLSHIAVYMDFNITLPKQNKKFSGVISEEVGTHSRNEGYHKIENSTVADLLYEKVKVLCLVMTYPENHAAKAKHVKATWGKRCNILLFMSSVKDESLPTVALNVSEGRNHLWNKTKEAFKYIYKNYLDKADWFLKADDDTYVIIENLRYVLTKHNATKPIYFGCRFATYVKQGYMSGGAGYVLSKNAVKRFVEIPIKNSTVCGTFEAEDINMGKCLADAQVEAGDTRDSMGRGRFFPGPTVLHLIPGMIPEWFHRFSFYATKVGMKCCSDSAISFHYVAPSQMYVLEYLIYHLRPYGVSLDFKMPLELIERPANVGITHSINDGEMDKNFYAVSFIRNTTFT